MRSGRLGLRVLVTGPRAFTKRDKLWAVLTALQPYSVVHGDADGTDTFAGQWARENDSHEIAREYPDHLAKGGGPLRNIYMLDTFEPDLVVACRTPGGPDAGTLHCIEAAFKRGIPVVQVIDSL